VVEIFEDLDADGNYDEGEPFTDSNGDGEWTPVWIAGYGREREALGVHDDLFARALVLETDRLRVGIVSVDWVGLLYDRADAIRDAAWVAGLGLNQLIVSSTHNHEGPDTMGLWGAGAETGVDKDYLAWAEERILEALVEAADNTVPVRLVAGSGKTDGLTRDSRRPEVIDESVVALRFDRTDSSGPVAVVVHWSNHPEVLDGDNQLITADFPGYLVAALEAAEPGAVGIYWQGIIGGLLNPLGVEVKDEQGNVLPHKSFEKAERIGELVAEAALSALERGEDVTAGGRLVLRTRPFLVPIDNFELELAAQSGIIERTIFDEQGRPRPMSDMGSFEPYLMTEVSVLDIGEVQVATVPGELYPELALVGPGGETFYEDPQDPGADYPGTPCSPPIYLSMRSTPYRMVLGLANDEVGYIIPKCQFDRRPPYTYGRDDPPYGESVCMGPDVAPTVNRVLAEELVALCAGDGLGN
jgi:hypothetical protein